MKLRYVGTTLAFGAVVLAPVSGFAQTNTVNATQPPANQQKVTQRCENVEKHLSTRSQKLLDRIQKREALYSKEDNKVQALLQKAKDKGVDTSKAQTDLDTWKDKTTQLKTARQALADSLKSAAQTDCGTASKGQFNTVREAGKDQLKKIAAIHNDKQSYFKNTLKPDLKALRDELKNKA